MLRSGRLLFSFFLLSGWACSRPALQRVQLQEYVFSDSTYTTQDPKIEGRIAPYRDSLNRSMARVLAESAQPLEKKQPEGKLGDFVADACLQEASALTRERIDLALFNHGGLRRSLPMGAITLGDVYELMPFDNELVVITLRGSKLLELLNHVASTGGAPVSGLRMLISSNLADSVRIGGEPLDTSRTYRVLTSDYLANGGDRYTAFADALGKEELRLRVRDAIVQRLEKLGQQRQTLVVTLDGRIQHAE